MTGHGYGVFNRRCSDPFHSTPSPDEQGEVPDEGQVGWRCPDHGLTDTNEYRGTPIGAEHPVVVCTHYLPDRSECRRTCDPEPLVLASLLTTERQRVKELERRYEKVVTERIAAEARVEELLRAGQAFRGSVEGARGDLAMGDPGRCEDRLHAACEAHKRASAAALSEQG